MRPQAMVTAADTDAIQYQEYSKERPVPGTVSMNEAIPGYNGDGCNKS
jgi:hypothetical protein